eukprot:Skav201394  [mRNA]  locus=scaffold296:246812:248836:+ [translate_table: standard]
MLQPLALVVNDSREPVKVFTYRSGDALKWICYESRSVQPGYSDIFHLGGQGFDLQLYAFNGKSCGNILCSTSVIDNFKISFSGNAVREEALRSVNDPFLFQVAKLKQVEQFTSAADHYGVLQLNREEMMKMSEEEQGKRIKKNFHQLILQRHPDKVKENPSLLPLAVRTIEAYGILSCPEKKRAYDHHLRSGSLLSKDFWLQLWTDMLYNSDSSWKVEAGISGFCVLGGLVLIVCSAGATAPGIFLLCTAGGGAVAGAGYLTGRELLKLKNREQGLEASEYGKLFAGGAVAGVVSGLAAGGGQALFVGMESAAKGGAAAYAGAGCIAGAGGGASFSMAEHMADEAWAPNSLLRAAALGAVGGAVSGAAAGAIGGAFVGQFADEAGGFAAIAAKKVAFEGLKGLAGGAASGVIDGIDEIAALDPAKDHAPLAERAGSAAMGVCCQAAKNCAFYVAAASVSHLYDKAKSHCMEAPAIDSVDEVRKLNGKVGPEPLAAEKIENSHVEMPLPTGEADGDHVWIGLQIKNASSFHEACLFVRYTLEGQRQTFIASGDGHGISVPVQARQVSVTFSKTFGLPTFGSPAFSEANTGSDVGQMPQWIWHRSLTHIPIQKWSRCTQTWCGPHIFGYEKPVSRTFVLEEGSLWTYVDVVLDENYHAVDDEGFAQEEDLWRCMDM